VANPAADLSKSNATPNKQNINPVQNKSIKTWL